jgi:hypothetical protein
MTWMVCASETKETLVKTLARVPSSLALLIALALLLTGCMHVDRSVSLNGDGSGSYALTVGFSQQVMSAAGAQINDAMNSFGQQVTLQGGSSRQYQDSGYSYWTFTRPFKSIADLNTLLQQNPQSNSSANSAGNLIGATQDALTFSEQAGLLGNTFHVKGHMSITAQAGSVGSVPSAVRDMRESFSVTMPGSVASHRGGILHGDTVTYVIHYGEQTDIDVVGGGLNLIPLIPYAIGAGVVLALLLILAGALLWRRSRMRGARVASSQRQPGVAEFAPVYTPAFTPPYSSAGPDAPTVPASPPLDDSGRSSAE